MKGQRVGYVRVSSMDQNPERQLENVELDRVFTDTLSGKNTNRPALAEMLLFVREGDTVIVHSMDRLARNLDDLRRLVQELTKKKVKVEFKKEQLSFRGDDSPMAQLLLSVMGAFAEFERAIIGERQREGIVLAQKRGAYSGRKKALTKSQLIQIQERVQQGEQKAQIARDMQVSRETLYKHLRMVQRG